MLPTCDFEKWIWTNLLFAASTLILVQKSIYGESLSDGAAHNLRGKVAQSMDQAGTLIATDYDWKGNLLHSTREFAAEYKQTLDWSSNITLLANSTYSNSYTSTTFIF